MVLCHAQSVGGSEKDLSRRCEAQVNGTETGQLMMQEGNCARGTGRDAGSGVGEAVQSRLLVSPPPLQTVAVSLQETPSTILLQSRRLSAALQR